MDERPSGWYDDPDEPIILRYWDGQSWTERTQEKAPMPAPLQPKPVTRLRPSRDDAETESGPRREAEHRDDHSDTTHTLDGPRPWETGRSGSARRGSPAQTGAGTAEAQAAAPRRAGYGRRVLAFLIDFLIISIVWFALFAALVPVVGGDVQAAWNSYVAANERYIDEVARAAAQSGSVTMPTRPEMPATLAAYTVASGFLLAGLAVLYDFLQVLLGRTTIGGRLTGIRVASADPNKPLTGGHAILRSLLKYAFLIASGPLALVGFVFAVFNFAWPIRDPQRRTLHDRWSETIVVRRR